MLNGDCLPKACRFLGMRDLTESIDTSQEAVAARLNLIMEAWGDQPTMFAAKLGVSPQTVSNWRSTQFISREGAVAVYRVYGVSIDWLLVGTEDNLKGDAALKIREARRKRLAQRA